ncbi:MAG TPA: hypothetical protein VE528_03200, partial [Thermoleophilaceae bacterium]|nr:hypothetical protein [Thermoleophilaceae bacterium]
ADMAPLSPEQRRKRARVESLIRLAAPGLSLVLAVGDRISRLVEPEDHGYYPPRESALEPPPPPDAEERR